MKVVLRVRSFLSLPLRNIDREWRHATPVSRGDKDGRRDAPTPNIAVVVFFASLSLFRSRSVFFPSSSW